MLGKGFSIGLEVIMRGIRSDTCPDSHIPFLFSGKLLHSYLALRLCTNVGLSIYPVALYFFNPCTVLLDNPVPFTSI